MAKQNVKAAENNNVDDLLGAGTESPKNTATGTEGTSTEGTGTEGTGTEVAEETADQKKARIDAAIKALKDQEKALKAELKGEKPKVDRVLKGHMVTFRNKAGEQVTGLGTLYYVTRMNGKLFYKEASQVAILPEGWKEGDALPALPGESVDAAK